MYNHDIRTSDPFPSGNLCKFGTIAQKVRGLNFFGGK